MANKNLKYGNIIESSRADATLTFSKYIKDVGKGKSVADVISEFQSKFKEIDDAVFMGFATPETSPKDGSFVGFYIAAEKGTYTYFDGLEIQRNGVYVLYRHDGAWNVYDMLSDSSVLTQKIADKAITTEKLDDEAVTIAKVNGEVWDKLEDEYLRRDGENYMKGNLDMAGNTITGVFAVSNGPNSILMGQEGYVMKVITDADYGGFKEGGDFDVLQGDATANGFKTKDRTNIGLIANDGSVGLPLTDTEIDDIANKVFIS